MSLQQLLSREFLSVVEDAAVACARTMGRGERKHSDGVAVEAICRICHPMVMAGFAWSTVFPRAV